MKIFWRQGGLHAEPDCDSERRVLSLVYAAAKGVGLAPTNAERKVGGVGGVGGVTVSRI